MRKNKIPSVFLFLFIAPAACWAAGLDTIKADLLRGNYRRAVFEGEAQIGRINAADADELNYLLGLSYLKEEKLGQAGDCFKRVSSGSSGKFKQQAELGLADTYLMGGRFQEAEDIYNKLISDELNNSQKPAVLYRLSQLEFKKGNNRRANDYLSELRREFPLSPELRLNKGLVLTAAPEPPVKNSDEYSVQVGFFSNRSNANNLKNELSARNYPVYLEADRAGYRVRVGKFKNRAEALDLKSRLSKEGYPTKIYP